MTVFDSSEQAREVFRDLFEILLKDDSFQQKMNDSRVSLHLIQTRPDLEMSVFPDGVFDGPPAQQAAIRMKMSCDTAHSLWKGELLMPLALGTGKVRIKGSVSKVLEFVPMLQPAFDRYPEIIATHGIAP